MNILIPHTWLLEHLETEASPEDIQRLLSLSGPSVERIYEKEGEPVYDIEVTTNRVDSMSVRGIAREAAVILNQAGVHAQLKPSAIPDLPQPQQTLPLPRIENNPELSKRVSCIILSGVERTPTPDYMAKRLKQIDQNVHDSVIDITNYVTHELGHPCHAFDYNKLMAQGGEIIITEAAEGEKFQTLDGLEFTTVGGEVVFKNGEGSIIDLPSIKGTANTSIDDSTKNVLLLLESIVAPKVRFASMTHAIRTVAAQLMEKNVDPYLIEPVLKRGVELYSNLCHASVASDMFDEFPNPPQMDAVTVTTQTLKNYLGVDLEHDTITNILQSLECTVEWTGEDSFKVRPPTFRPDITIPADVVEELARIYGYHNLPSKIMDTPIPLNKPSDVDFRIEHRVKQFLADLGLQELYTYSMVSEALAQQAGYPLGQYLKLQNPLTDDRVYLRRSLIPSLYEVLDSNSEYNDLSIFELANVYHPQENDLPKQELYLTILSQMPYRETRGVLEALLRQFFIEDLEIKTLHENTAEIWVNGENVGFVLVLPKNRIAVTLYFAKFLQHVQSHPKYKPLPKAAPLYEDLTFTLPEKTAVGKVISTIAGIDSKIANVELKDIYQQNYSFMVTFLNQDSSLSAAEVEPIRKAIIEKVQSEFGAQLVGAV